MPQGWLGLDWGNVPAWTGSVLTGSSLLIAANTYRRAVQDRVREQASKFAVWISKTPEDGRVQLSFANGSDVPVYNVRVELIAYGPPPTGRGRPVLLENPWPEHADVVPPSGLPARDLSYYSAKV
ncbi:MAG: hypothetical protein JWP46_3806, partial [Modestobacter sp.]|nr:hypothetical protein [Modestobacter sp.]